MKHLIGILPGFLLLVFLPALQAEQPVLPPEDGQFQLYLLIGQSNMAGRGRLDEEAGKAHPRVLMLTKDNRWALALDPLHFDKASAGVGLGSSFGRAMAQANPGRTIGLVPCAVGGTPLSRWQKDGDLYRQAVSRVRAAMQDGTLAGILWHQGEGDAVDERLAATYADRLVAMIRQLRQDLQTPDVPFVAGELGEFLPDVKNGKPYHWRTVNEQLAVAAKLVPAMAVAGSENLGHKGDSVHFDTPSLRKLGVRYAVSMRELQSERAATGEQGSPTDETQTVRWTGGGRSNRWGEPANWEGRVPDGNDAALFENTNAKEAVAIDGVVEVGRIEVRLPQKTDRLVLAGGGTVRLRGTEAGIPGKFFTGFIVTGILDIGPELHVSIGNQRFIAGNEDGTVVIRSNKVRAGEKEPTSRSCASDGENLKLGITDRGRLVLATSHWEPEMSLDMSAGHTEGPKVFEFAGEQQPQGVTFIRLKEHDGDPVEIHGFEPGDYFRFQADPLTSCDKGKEFRIEAVRFIGWTQGGAAAVCKDGDHWYLKPLGQPVATGGGGDARSCQ